MTHCRRTGLAGLALVLGAVSPVRAQQAPARSPTESITVTGIKDVDKAVKDFVGAMTVPTRVAGKLARWKQGICPVVAGVRPEAVKLVTKLIRDIAAEVGAPVNGRDSCKANVEIVFTTTPQALLDTIFIKYPYLLGYHDNSAQATKLAAVKWPIQSWYSTATDDLRGNVLVDGVKPGGVLTMDMPISPAGTGGGIQTNAGGTVTLNMPGAQITNVTGGRLSDGVSSDFNHVVIVVEPARLLDYELGTLADYIAFLALSQVEQPDHCQELPTILNLLAPGCTTPAKALTGVDLAYLHALYKMTPTASVHGQRDELIYQMDKSLGAKQ
jgi:hypothetical protein